MSDYIHPPEPPNVWDDQQEQEISCFVRHPWEWVMRKVSSKRMTIVVDPSELPSNKQQQVQVQNGALDIPKPSPMMRRRTKSLRKGIASPSTLKIEVCNPKTSEVEFAAHGTSVALDGMEDKDELVRTLQRCRCEDMSLSPPSILINWDVSQEECRNVVGKDLPMLKEFQPEHVVAVLKEPMGSQGKGIYFVKSTEEIHKVIQEHHDRAVAEPQFLDNLIERKGRIPSWVLQAEIRPCLLIRDRRKFHIRTYLAVVENLQDPDLVDVYIYNRHEVRIAGVPVEENETDRNRLAHITNGALSNSTERVLLSEVPELTSRGLQEKIEVFVAETFGKHFMPDMMRRVGYSIQHDDSPFRPDRKFSIAGLDLMVTEANKIYLLEVNVNPAAPPEEMVDKDFSDHLYGFLRDLVDLVVGRPAPNFVPAKNILAQHGLLE